MPLSATLLAFDTCCFKDNIDLILSSNSESLVEIYFASISLIKLDSNKASNSLYKR
nr:MAG TPA: hypothetical protein [Crassvirales sp.]